MSKSVRFIALFAVAAGVLLLAAASAFAGNGQVAGQVVEKKTKEPIIGARVRLLLPDATSAKMGAISDASGNFHILNVPSGMYQIEISYGPSYAKQLIKDVKVESDRKFETGVVRLAEQAMAPATWLGVPEQ